MKGFTFYEQIILDSINFDGELLDRVDDFTDINVVFDDFVVQAGWNVLKIGERNAFREWLQGLPAILSVDPYNKRDILTEALKKGALTMPKGYNKETILDLTRLPEKFDKFLESYWYRLTDAFFTLRDNL